MHNDQITRARRFLVSLEDLERQMRLAREELDHGNSVPSNLKDPANRVVDEMAAAARSFRMTLDLEVASAAGARESEDRHARTPLLRALHKQVYDRSDAMDFLSPVRASRDVVDAALSTRGQEWAVAPIAGDGPAVLSGVDLADALEELVRRGPRARMAVFFMGNEPASWEPTPAQEASYYWTELETGPQSGVFVDLVTAL